MIKKISIIITILSITCFMYSCDEKATETTREEVQSEEKLYTVDGIFTSAGAQEILANKLGQTDNITLEQLEAVTVLDLSTANGIDDISNLYLFGNLTELNLIVEPVSDISALEFLTKLEVLELVGNDITNIDSLRTLTNLKYLNLGNNDINDFSAISNMENLEYLNIKENSDEYDMEFMTNLSNLKDLEISIYNIKDTSAIRSLTNLECLVIDRAYCFGKDDATIYNDLAYLSKLGTLSINSSDLNTSYFKKMSSLENLYVDNCTLTDDDGNYNFIGKTDALSDIKELSLTFSVIVNIDNISKMTELKYLNLSENYIIDIAAIGYLDNLYELDLSANIGLEDIKPISSLTSLIKLDLGFCNISDISPLVTCKKLERLLVCDNEIVEVETIAEIGKLKYLDISYNKVTDIGAISNLKELEELYMSNNEIMDISVLNELPNLKIVNISNNPLDNCVDIIAQLEASGVEVIK